MSRRSVLFLSLSACLLLAGVPGPEPLSGAETGKLNVLFLVADDLNCDLGCYGHPEMRTPNIDALAARGVRFEHAYCQYPSCGPSRASFLTGRRPNVTKILSNPHAGLMAREYSSEPHFRQFLPDTVTLPELFRKQGYTVGRIGKMFHYGVPGQIGTDGADDARSWEFVFNPAGRDKVDEPRIFTINPQSRGFGGTLSWLAADGTDSEQTDGLSAIAAVNLLEKYRDQPFFLAVGCFRPHTPYISPKKYFELYPPSGISLPELSTDDRSRTPALAYSSATAQQDRMPDDLRRQAIQAYHAAISFMDAQMGKVLEALDRLQLTDKTIVVLISDHGYHMADHGLWQKMSLFENSNRVPMIIAAPGAAGNGRSASTMAELVDLYPTLADLCGLPAPDYLDGVSLVPALQDPAEPVKEAAFTQIRRRQTAGVAVRTSHWRYVLWDQGRQGEQLFDMLNDPGETRNLAADPAHAATVSELRALAISYMSNLPESAAIDTAPKR